MIRQFIVDSGLIAHNLDTISICSLIRELKENLYIYVFTILQLLQKLKLSIKVSYMVYCQENF